MQGLDVIHKMASIVEMKVLVYRANTSPLEKLAQILVKMMFRRNFSLFRHVWLRLG